jgi:hypothetical protein
MPSFIIGFDRIGYEYTVIINGDTLEPDTLWREWTVHDLDTAAVEFKYDKGHSWPDESPY